jgi:hypothetical protein
MVEASREKLSGEKGKSPTKIANNKVTRTMLAIWPKMRVIATAEDAAPRNLFSTEPIIAFTLGVENKLNPKPVMNSANIIRGSESSLPNEARASKPTAVINMPDEASQRGSS